MIGIEEKRKAIDALTENYNKAIDALTLSADSDIYGHRYADDYVTMTKAFKEALETLSVE